MHIIAKREEFLKLPAGTLFRKISLPGGDLMDGLMVKADTAGNDFNYYPMWDAVDLEYEGHDVPDGRTMISWAVEHDLPFEIDYHETKRDGLNDTDDEVCYAIYERADVDKFIAFLQGVTGHAGMIEKRREESISEETKNLVANLYKRQPELRKEVRTLKSQLKAPYFLSAIGTIAVGGEPSAEDKEAVENISRTFTRILTGNPEFADKNADQKFIDFIAGSTGMLIHKYEDRVRIYCYTEVPDLRFDGARAIETLRPNRKPGE